MKPIKYLILPLLLLASALPSHANSNKELLIKKFQKQLSRTTNARDSLRILYDIFDLSDRKGQNEIAWQIYDTSGRAADETSQANILRQLAVFNFRNDSIVNVLIGHADKISNDERRDATRTFIYNQRLSTINSRDAMKYLTIALTDANGKRKKVEDLTIYDKICILHHILHYLGTNAHGVLFKEIMEKYQELIESLPSSDYPLKNQFYTTAAIINSKYGADPAKAVESDLHLLKIIETLEEFYRNKNRIYRNYDPQKFICYRRILSNYPDLTQEEVQMTYDSVMAIYERDYDVHNTMERESQSQAYYYMAMKDYAKAIPALRKYLEYKKQDPPYQHLKQYKMLLDATKDAGDIAGYNYAMEKYIRAKDQLDSIHDEVVDKEIILRDSLTDTSIFTDVSADEEMKRHSRPHVPVSYYIISSLLTILLCVFVTLYMKLRMRK